MKDKARIFMTRWLQLGDPDIEIIPECSGLVPGRKFRADFAFPDQKVIVEIDGGLFGFWGEYKDKHTGRKKREWRRGGHSSIQGQLKDMERSNLLAAHGWRVIRFTPQHLDGTAKDPAGCIELVLEALLYEKKD
jgi:very-short-patch-repair endonuclease